LAAPSFAGDVTGSGKRTPIENIVLVANPIVRNAICAFSGLEDVNLTPGNTQTPHEEGGNISDPGVARVCSLLNYGKRH
jgi:hypothetical protein